MQRFSTRVIAWQRLHGRHTFPWQVSRDPYRIWLSEIMLQQTQVATVIPYFLRFVARFPDLPTLADANEDEVLALWSGLGYYSRARNLHLAARRVMTEYGGRFPEALHHIESLPGVGRSTAAAIAALAFGQTKAILDGNVKRVLTRHAGIDGWPGDPAVASRLWALAEARLPAKYIEPYTQGMMDLGATVCTRTRPACSACPVAGDCKALHLGLTGRLPSAKPKKTMPEKKVQMLIVRNGTKTLLEKRPRNGIWGGLWSFPELESDSDPIEHCKFVLGLSTNHAFSLPPVRHCFTHYRLYISPIVLNLVPETASALMAHQQWFAPQEVLHAALPAPVRKLLLQL